MNLIFITGRLTKDPEMRQTSSNISVCKFTVAVDRTPTKSGERVTDFFDCTAFRQTADFIGQYFNKGDGINIRGEMHNNPYDDKEGKRRSSWGILVDRVEFPHGKRDGHSSNAAPTQREYAEPTPRPAQNTFSDLGDDFGELPF